MEPLTTTFIFQLYILGFIGSFVFQSYYQRSFGEGSNWGANRGWQNEIAIWNLFASLTLYALVMGHFESELVVIALLLMSAGFGANHLLAIKKRNLQKK